MKLKEKEYIEKFYFKYKDNVIYFWDFLKNLNGNVYDSLFSVGIVDIVCDSFIETLAVKLCYAGTKKYIRSGIISKEGIRYK